ncbi:MAG: cell division FtsA domain-containing protein [Halanaerobiaceae bacterium]
MKKQGNLIFTLDIGTRTVIGLVMEHRENQYKILASHVVEHEERAMLDGQIHNVNLVTAQVEKVKTKLEKDLNIKLERVAIAAAGRALKTIDYEESFEFREKKIITEEDVKSLEFSAVQKAQTRLMKDSSEDAEPLDYHFVGYSVTEYYLDGMNISVLEGQKGKTIKTKIISTFLPRVVVDSLLTVINKTGLEVEYLTLEPIAAANVVIPKDMHNFNLALVDIGAGTSDIALTKGGSMLGYAMVPVAGDEITEALAEHYLLDYNTGEKTKRFLSNEGNIKVRNILSQEIDINAEEAFQSIDSIIDSLASQISEAILILNGKPPQAVICIGGGSLTPGLLDGIARFLDISPSRVGVKEYKDIKNVRGEISGINTAQANTPIGIAISGYINKTRTNFVNVSVNDIVHQLFTINTATLADALLAAEIDFRVLHGNPGMGMTCTVNGELKVIKGEMGQAGILKYNGVKTTDLKQEISTGDKIEYIPGRSGSDANAVIGDIIPELPTLEIEINNQKYDISPEIYQDGLLVDKDTPVIDGSDIKYEEVLTIREAVAHIYKKNKFKLTNEYINYSLNGEIEYLPKNDILVMADDTPIDLDIPVEEISQLQVIKNRGTSSVKNIIEKKLSNEITITFNGSQISIPVGVRIYRNGKELEDYNVQIKNGDKFVYKKQSITVRKVFNFVNYKITTFIKKSKIDLNGKQVTLDEPVHEGDKLKVAFGKKSSL